MGQYFKGAVLKKNHKLAKQPVLFSLSSYKFDNGAKLTEHSYIGNHYVNAYMNAISDDNGCFFGYPFVWIGDYADSINGKDYYDFTYNVCDKSFKNFSKELDLNKYYKYLVNFSKKQYVKLPEYDDKIWNMHPLPLLTAYGNGRGCGDYRNTDIENVGIWSFDRIGATNDDSYIVGMKEIKVGFEPDF